MAFIGQQPKEQAAVSLPAHDMIMAWIYSLRSNKIGAEDGVVMVDSNHTIIGLGHNSVIDGLEIPAVTNAFVQRTPSSVGIAEVYCLHKPIAWEVVIVRLIYPRAKFFYLYGEVAEGDPNHCYPLPPKYREEVGQFVELRQEDSNAVG